MGKANTQKFITLSKYRYMFRHGGRCFLYAPLSNGFAELDEETYLQLEAIGHGSSAALSDDVIDMLRRLKVADVDEDSEVNRSMPRQWRSTDWSEVSGVRKHGT